MTLEQLLVTTTSQRWLNEKEAASMLGVSVYTLRQHRFKGIGVPYVKYGKSVRYSIADICAYFDSLRVEHCSNLE